MHAAAVPEVGQAAPDFRLRGPGGQYVSLSEYQGDKTVVVVFFPLAFSPVCSHQLPEIQKRFARFAELDAVVLGVSIDSHYANEAFARSLHLDFPLLSDFHRETIRAYGVLDPDKNYSGRATFVVDKQGRIAYEDVSANPRDIPDLDRLFDALARLG